MFEAFINLNSVPTHVMSWGKWIEEDLSDTKLIVLFIPGNPGLLGFYREFLETIYQQLGEKVPVWTVGHGGHEVPESSLRPIPIFQTHKDLYDLKAQIEHKAAFIQKYVPKHTKLVIMGHSIGAYICVELLNNTSLQNQIDKSYLLFPTIEHMARTARGKFLNKFVRYFVTFLVFCTWFFNLLPTIVQEFLIKVYLFLTRAPLNFSKEVYAFLKPNVIRNVLFMALDEMEHVNERNDTCIQRFQHKMKFYYGRTDHWAPVSYYTQLKREYPTIDAEVCDFEHAFVLKNAKDVGIIASNWIQQDFSV